MEQELLDRITIQDLLAHAGYKLNRRDGLKYPCYCRLDSDGRRIKGDKFIVMPGNKCCFQPPIMRVYNAVSLIENFPEMFPESASGLRHGALVNAVCRKILNMPPEHKELTTEELRKETVPFDIKNYRLQQIDKADKHSMKKFSPYFDHRGIGIMTQHMFRNSFYLASRERKDGKAITNLSFPLRIPGEAKIVGFEERGAMRLDGSKGYKGKALGSNASEGLWIASPNNTRLKDAKHVLWFESAYDAMAYFQTHVKKNYQLYKSVFISTGGTPTVMQMRKTLQESPKAIHHLCFDNDLAGRQFSKNFYDVARKLSPLAIENVPRDMQAYVDSFRYIPKPDGDTMYDPIAMQEVPLPNSVKQSGFLATAVPLLDDLISHAGEKLDLLPEDLQKAYKEDEGGEVFKKLMLHSLKVQDGKYTQVAKIEREVPQEGYKDWNEELLGEEIKKQGGKVTTTIRTGLDLDGDGEEDVIEEEKNVEDRKHMARRHTQSLRA